MTEHMILLSEVCVLAKALSCLPVNRPLEISLPLCTSAIRGGRTRPGLSVYSLP